MDKWDKMNMEFNARIIAADIAECIRREDINTV